MAERPSESGLRELFNKKIKTYPICLPEGCDGVLN